MKAFLFLALILIVNLYLVFSEKDNENKSDNNYDSHKDSSLETRLYSNQFDKVKEVHKDQVKEVKEAFLKTILSEDSSSMQSKVRNSSCNTNYLWKSVLFIGMVLIFY